MAWMGLAHRLRVIPEVYIHERKEIVLLMAQDKDVSMTKMKEKYVYH